MKIKEFHGFVYTRATAAANFINISTGIPSDVHEYKKIFRARALCTRSTNFIDFGVEIRRVITTRDDVELIRDDVDLIRDGVDLVRDDIALIRIRNDVDVMFGMTSTSFGMTPKSFGTNIFSSGLYAFQEYSSARRSGV